MTRVKSISSPRLVLALVVACVVEVLVTVPFWHTLHVSRTSFYPEALNEVRCEPLWLMSPVLISSTLQESMTLESVLQGLILLGCWENKPVV